MKGNRMRRKFSPKKGWGSFFLSLKTGKGGEFLIFTTHPLEKCASWQISRPASLPAPPFLIFREPSQANIGKARRMGEK
jgi:hypothetical protein